MSKSFEMPDMGDMDDWAQQLKEAMEAAEQAVEGIPDEAVSFDVGTGSLGSMLASLSTSMGELTAGMSDFSAQHEANHAALTGDPDWELEATVRVGEVLHLVVDAALDLAKIRQAWTSTQSDGFESLVSGVVADTGGTVDPSFTEEIAAQLGRGRASAAVRDVRVLACRIQGAPAGAAESLQLSPEAGIPMTLDERGLGLEFAPLLTIRNSWERAGIPTFSPMGGETVVPLEMFAEQKPFETECAITSQEMPVHLEFRFRPLG